MRCVLPVEWTLYANDSGENHCLALADHQVIFAGTKFVTNTLDQVRVYEPLG